MNLSSRFKFSVAVGLVSSAVIAAANPPVAPVEKVVDTYHGITVADPYRWMENVKSAATQAWLKQQGEYARDSLDRIAQRSDIQKRIDEMSATTGDVIRDIVRMPGERVYYLKRTQGGKQFKLMMRHGLRGHEKLLVDPEVLSAKAGVPHAINYFSPSWNGRYVAYGVSAGGSEEASLYILDVATGKLLGQPIPRVHENLLGWLPDSRSLTYNQVRQLAPTEPDTETYLDSKVMWLNVGQPESTARAVFGPTVTPQLGLARLDVASLIFSPDSHWVIARTTDTTLPEGFLFVAPVAQLGKPDIVWQRVARYEDKITDVKLRGNDLFMLTPTNAPRNKVLRLGLLKPSLNTAVTVAVAPENAVLEEFEITRSDLIATIRQGTDVGLRRYAYGDVNGHAVKTPYSGTAHLHADPAHSTRDALYTLDRWTDLARTYVLQGERSTEIPLGHKPALTSLPTVEVTQVIVPSHDGVGVPMTILSKKGTTLDGSNPTLLESYASYGFSLSARFSPANMVWLERGGVLAFANVRGSGVYGHDWYQAGFKQTKSNTWKDGVACAKYLIAKGWTSPKTLAVTGTSAGGIFVGRVVTTAPELFAAAIFNVGVMDAVRAEESANGITNISEFGTVKNAAEFPALLDMSTYHQIKDATPYPAVMLIHGMNDPRVDVWNSAKAAARLQAATSSGKPILLRLDGQAGHGVGSTANQRNAQTADIYSFLLWQMGKANLRQ